MKAASAASSVSGNMRSERFHLWRSRKDQAVRWAIAVGGVGVIAAVVLIFFYLLWVVFPLFLPADTHLVGDREVPAWKGSEPLYLAVEEQQEGMAGPAKPEDAPVVPLREAEAPFGCAIGGGLRQVQAGHGPEDVTDLRFHLQHTDRRLPEDARHLAPLPREQVLQGVALGDDVLGLHETGRPGL